MAQRGVRQPHEMKTTDARPPGVEAMAGVRERRGAVGDGHRPAAQHPAVEFAVTAPEEVDQMFDAITYGKGSAVLHMVDEFIGAEALPRAVSRLPPRPRLREHRRPPTWWKGLDRASEWPVTEILEHLGLPAGFPQIAASRVPGGARLSQHRYLVTPTPPTPRRGRCRRAPRGRRRPVGLSQEVLLTARSDGVASGDVDWLVANVGGQGFYRTALLRRGAQRPAARGLGQLDDVERYAVVSDTFASCAAAGRRLRRSSTWSRVRGLSASRRSGR